MKRLAVLALSLGLAGCLGPIPVSLPSGTLPPLPEQGRQVNVTVLDERSESSPARIGLLAGGVRILVIEGDASLAIHVEDELVAALRRQGYRAEHARDARPQAEVTVTVRVVRFAAEPSRTKPRFEGRSVLVAALAGGDPQSVWMEVIDSRQEVPLGTFTGIEGLKSMIHAFFRAAAADLANHVKTGLAP